MFKGEKHDKELVKKIAIDLGVVDFIINNILTTDFQAPFDGYAYPLSLFTHPGDYDGYLKFVGRNPFPAFARILFHENEKIGVFGR